MRIIVWLIVIVVGVGLYILQTPSPVADPIIDYTGEEPAFPDAETVPYRHFAELQKELKDTQDQNTRYVQALNRCGCVVEEQ